MTNEVENTIFLAGCNEDVLTEGHDFSSRALQVREKSTARQRLWEGQDKQARHGCDHSESSPLMW